MFNDKPLVQGLTNDLLASEPGFWGLFPDHERLSFDDAAREALAAEEPTLPASSRLLEITARRLSVRARRPK